eukprot:8004331-Karenia_brevis.AAC.1
MHLQGSLDFSGPGASHAPPVCHASCASNDAIAISTQCGLLPATVDILTGAPSGFKLAPEFDTAGQTSPMLFDIHSVSSGHASPVLTDAVNSDAADSEFDTAGHTSPLLIDAVNSDAAPEFDSADQASPEHFDANI